ncbi:hypothetical protein CSOJ01_08573 [Colletotrichum sojae]|uniref:Uncharacterized protein n=1 Tax=Colletotrichum sojae TaxID=2175907 RepID=A0A8H6MSR6_9PEZI|nr:hypothetical protein CSOJ01_08573 [Colletotrichum sojae]
MTPWLSPPASSDEAATRFPSDRAGKYPDQASTQKPRLNVVLLERLVSQGHLVATRGVRRTPKLPAWGVIKDAKTSAEGSAEQRGPVARLDRSWTDEYGRRALKCQQKITENFEAAAAATIRDAGSRVAEVVGWCAGSRSSQLGQTHGPI